MIHVIAEIVTKPGQREAVLAEFQKIAPAVRQEPGCLEYGAALETAAGLPVQPPVRDNVITVIEKWESLELLHQHLGAAPLQSFLQKTQHMIESLSARVLSPVG
ncbi:MAG TPA: putative quinol monooxygenase [Thermogutta sp.]|nr:putative quinol monooxygenase [Thermogutta sp.]